MNFEFLAQEHTEAESARWNWQSHASHLRRDVTKPEDLTGKRTTFLIRHAMTLEGVTVNDALADTRRARGRAKLLLCPTQELEKAKLFKPVLDVTRLPEFSASITLQFQLLAPLLTRDDDPFYLFDNPVRKDHIFGVPHLAAASLKGLAADAFQRGFPHQEPWATLGDKDQTRTIRYRRDNAIAERLFGNASDDPDAFTSQGGRLHFSPVWFSHVEFLVMNPTKDDGSGIGTQPIQFEAVAPVDERGKPAKAEVSFFYFNPAGTKDADEATARADLACLVGALAAWWPTLGLGAKRLAGYTWGSSYDSSKARLKLSGLVSTCLLNFSSTDLAACWDAWDQPGGLAPSYWVALVSAAEARDPASIASAILNALAAATRQDSVRWQSYLAEAQRHLFGGSFKLEQIGAMVDWLEQAKPTAQEIPHSLHLIWLTVNLARANHLGATEHEWLAELTRLSGSLYEEAAPLCCHADLHLAVAMTNRFDFAGAAQAVAPWHDRHPAIPGLRYWAQCRSTMGQHFAFVGDLRAAQTAFSDALDAFSRLSDPVMRRKEIDQTSCYAAISAMDDMSLNDVDARAMVEAYLGNLDDAVNRLASSDNSEHYRHHTLLRWIVSRQDQALGDAYKEQRPSWSSGFGHPWPLIEIYRAMLIRAEDPDGAIDQARTAAAIAFTSQQGPTVRLIGACCRAIGVAWGDPWEEKIAVLSELRESLPYARDRIDRLELFMNEPKQALELLREVLPFNFH